MQASPIASSWRERALQDEVFVRNVSSLAALVCLMCEYVTTFDDEYRCIWKRTMNRIRFLYLFSRYFALGSLLLNVWVVMGPLSNVPVPSHECKAWFIALAVSSCTILATIDIVVMMRVYVLYNRSTKVALFLASLLLMQGMLVTICTARTIHTVPFDAGCDVLTTPHQVVYFMAGVIVSQVILLIMTVKKRKIAFGQSPVVDLVVRDGAWIFVVVVGVFSINIPYSLFVQVSKPHLVFVWPIVILSVAACRLIINMQKIEQRTDNANETSSTDTNITFTSFIDMSVDSSSSLPADEVGTHSQTSSLELPSG